MIALILICFIDFNGSELAKMKRKTNKQTNKKQHKTKTKTKTTKKVDYLYVPVIKVMGVTCPLIEFIMSNMIRNILNIKFILNTENNHYWK